jgi:hypothetical protein
MDLIIPMNLFYVIYFGCSYTCDMELGGNPIIWALKISYEEFNNSAKICHEL